MHIDDFRRVQRSGAAQNIHWLFMSCRRRFLDAARLLELNDSDFHKLISSGFDTVDLSPLMSMYGVLCDRYAEQFFTPQEDLFGSPADAQDSKWNAYFHHVLIPHLIQEDEFVRNILRAMMVIPCKNSQFSSLALLNHLSEMTLPETRPLWAPEEAFRY